MQKIRNKQSRPHIEILAVTVRNKFNTLQETSERYTPEDEYKNFIAAHMEAAAKCIPRAKCKVHWELLVVRKNTR